MATRRCTCGTVTAVGDIHTCSPVTDAARLEAARDTMRPRVEGEAEPPICRDCGDHFDGKALCWGCARDVEAERDELAAKIAALTAEVERLRGVEGAYNALMAFVALALPTNAPEAKPLLAGISKERWIKMIDREDGSDVSVGSLPSPAQERDDG